jgi:hypothetical protein
MTCIKTGATVHFVDYGQVLAADIYKIANAILVRVQQKDALRQNYGFDIDPKEATHEVYSNPGGANEFWREDLGVFVVPEANLTVIRR